MAEQARTDVVQSLVGETRALGAAASKLAFSNQDPVAICDAIQATIKRLQADLDKLAAFTREDIAVAQAGASKVEGGAC
jgi:hypothetical protein